MTLETTYAPDNPSLLAQLKAYQQYHPIVLAAAALHNLDWWVIAGLGSRESHWGLALIPKGPGGSGDGGHGLGLMQIDSRSHEFARTGPWSDAEKNIEYGCQVLRQSLEVIKRRCTNSLGEAAVKYYQPDMLISYGLAAYNAGPLAVLTAIREGRDCDSCTTGGDYSSDVLNRAGWFQSH